MKKKLFVSSIDKRIVKSKVHKLVGCLQKELNFSVVSLCINFINSEEIHKINKRYLNHDFSTDIITFNYSGSNSDFDGEVFISVDDARLSTKKYKTTFSNELSRLVIHGMLHLNGFNDIKRSDKLKMKRMEDYLTMKYNFSLLG